MRRRDLVVLAGAALVSPRPGRAQQTERVRRIGYLTPATGAPDNIFGVLQTRALVEGLRELGWADGRNIAIEHRFAGDARERIRANAKELVALNPDVIMGVGGPVLAALLAETRTIPIVFSNVNDPVGGGFVASLARPGGNATGVAVSEAPIAGKWVELLKEIAPGVTRVMVLMEADARPQKLLADTVAAAAPQNTIIANNMERVHALAARYRLPAVYSYPIYAKTGGLLSYGADNFALFHEVARYIDQILRGAKPGDLPVQQPTRFLLAVNLKTAKALGLSVSQSILARADEVIE
ncbi:MAG: ABC transporter substrate-binding protein [Alphaproteobacteria bacterium]|nr:MAG: ABC transporter substrate-binding protein [Alphaproteobacteria bacterium]